MDARSVALALAVALVALPLAAAPAAACCHVKEIERSVGPCTARWEGDLFFLQHDRVSASCTAAGETVGASVDVPVPGPREGGSPWDAIP